MQNLYHKKSINSSNPKCYTNVETCCYLHFCDHYVAHAQTTTDGRIACRESLLVSQCHKHVKISQKNKDRNILLLPNLPFIVGKVIRLPLWYEKHHICIQKEKRIFVHSVYFNKMLNYRFVLQIFMQLRWERKPCTGKNVEVNTKIYKTRRQWRNNYLFIFYKN